MKSQYMEGDKDEQHTGKLIRKNPGTADAYQF